MDSRFLGVGVGLVTLYLLYSIVTSHFNELIAQLLETRSKGLVNTLRTKLLDENLTTKLLAHPLIKSLAYTKDGLPRYIPATTFARALLDIVRKVGATGGTTWSEIVDEAALPDEVRQRLRAALGPKEKSIEEAEQRLAEWFDRSMVNLSAHYRRHAQLSAFLTGLVLVCATNADTLRMTATLWRDPVARQAEVKVDAELFEQCKRAQDGTLTCPQDLFWSNMPLRWNRAEWTGKEGWPLVFAILLKLLGLVVTAAAVSLGAPFWFDLLGKVSPKREPEKTPV